MRLADISIVIDSSVGGPLRWLEQSQRLSCYNAIVGSATVVWAQRLSEYRQPKTVSKYMLQIVYKGRHPGCVV